MALAWDQAPQWGKRQKRQKRGEIEQRWRRAAVAGGGASTTLSLPRLPLGLLRSPIFFPRTPISPFSPNAEPGPRLMWPQTRERAVEGSIFGLCVLNRIKEFIVINVL